MIEYLCARWQLVKSLPMAERHLLTLEHMNNNAHLKNHYDAALTQFKKASAAERRAMQAKIGL